MANKTLDQLTQKTGKLADTEKFHVRGANDQYMEFPDLYKQTGLHAYGSLGALITQFQSENIFRDGDRVELLGFGAAGDGGGGPVFWDPNEDRANHNGGSIIDPTHSATPGDVAGGWYDSENSGTGCFKTENQNVANVKRFGLGLNPGSYDEDGPFISLLQNFDDVIIPWDATVSLGGDSNDFEIAGSKSLIGLGRTSKIEFQNQSAPVGTYVYPLWVKGEQRKTTTLSADVAEGDFTLPLADVSGIEVGDLIEIEDGGLAERSRVLEVGVSDVTINDRLYRGYTSAGATVTIYKYASFDMRNVSWMINTGDTFAAVMGYYLQDSRINDNYFDRDPSLGEYSGRTGILYRHSYGGQLKDNRIFNFNNTADGYGIQVYGVRNASIKSNTIFNCRSFDLSAGPEKDCINNLVEGNTIINHRTEASPGGSSSNEPRGLSTHPGVYRAKFIGNKVIGTREGIFDRGDYNEFENNTIDGAHRINFGSGEKAISKGNTFIGIDIYQHADRNIFISKNDTIKTKDSSSGNKIYLFPLLDGSFKSWVFENIHIEILKTTTGEFRLFGANTATEGTFSLENLVFKGTVNGEDLNDSDLVFSNEQWFAGSLINEVSLDYLNVVPDTVRGKQEFFLTFGTYNLHIWDYTESLEITFRFDRLQQAEINSSFGKVSVVGSRNNVTIEDDKSSSFSDEFVFGVAEDTIKFSQVTPGFRYNYQAGAAVSISAVGSNNEFKITIAPWSSNPGWSWAPWSVALELTSLSQVRLVSAQFV